MLICMLLVKVTHAKQSLFIFIMNQIFLTHVISFIIYALGIPFYIYARHQFQPNEKVFTKVETGFAIAIVLIAIIGVFIVIV